MPRIRQQRNRQNRRTLQRGSAGMPEDITWTIVEVDGADVRLNFPSLPSGLVETGIVGLVDVAANAGPISQVWDGDELVLTYAVAPTLPATFVLDHFNPSLRTRWGGWLAPGEVTVEASGGGVDLEWSIDPGSYSPIYIIVAGATGDLIGAPTGFAFTAGGGGNCNSVSASPGIITLTPVGGGWATGDPLQYEFTAGAWYDSAGNRLKSKTESFP